MKYDPLDHMFRGYYSGNAGIKASRISAGRFREERNATIIDPETGVILCEMKVFTGRKPYYRPWIEIFNIREYFHGSPHESVLLDLVAGTLEEGESLFIEYYNDSTTRKELELRVPTWATRLGYELTVRGFLYQRDWYFPEGFMEGGQKLQAQKPLAARLQDNIEMMRTELQLFINSNRGSTNRLIREALVRAENILKLQLFRRYATA